MSLRQMRGNLQVLRPGPASRVTVVGLARSGKAMARWLRRLKCVVRVTEVADTPALRVAAGELKAEGVSVELGRHTRRFIEDSDLVVVSPGVPLSAPPLRWASAAGIPVVSELECASWYCSGRLVAVTGSNGKSTVVTLLGQILRSAGLEVVVCGNIGQPLSAFLDRIRSSTVVVVEVSSFQLETSLSFHPEVACLLNVTDNHLDRHGTLDRYRRVKSKLFSYQSRMGWAVMNADDPGLKSLHAQIPAQRVAFSREQKVVGAYMAQGQLRLNLPWISGPICWREELSLPGIHHEENALAAACMAGILGIPPDSIRETLRSFRGLEHRQEKLFILKGVTFINDSKSTTVASGLRAIEAAPGPVILIAGGRDKGSDFRPLRKMKKKLKAVVLMGEDGPRIARSLRGAVPLKRSQDLRAAVQTAYALAKAGECVLLSPMCTSFDMFRDFEERGERFVEAVKALTNGNGVALTPPLPLRGEPKGETQPMMEGL